MNTIKFDQTLKKFPLSTQSLGFMQAIIQHAHKLALLGGTGKYILSGCENTTGTTWAAGSVVINGELLPFMGGTGQLTSSVRIKQTKTDVVAEFDTYPEVYTERYLEFGSNIGGADTFVWNTFTRVKSNLQLAAESATKLELEALSNLMMPKGGIIMWSGTIAAIPTGYELCDGNGGAPVNGLTIPDLRGRFIVGVDERINQSQPTDVTDLTQNYGAIGSRGGRPNVTLQTPEMPSHTHAQNPHNHTQTDHSHTVPIERNVVGNNMTGVSGDIDVADSMYNLPTSGAVANIQDATATNQTTGGGTAHENRPPYFVLAYIIKTV